MALTERTIDEVYNAVLVAFKAWIESEFSGAVPPVAYDNVNFDPEAEFDATDVQLQRWLRVSFAHAGGGAAALGNEMYRRTGTVIVQCFARVNVGRALANATAEGVIKFFETADVSGIWFREQSLSEAGDDGAWYQVNVSTLFQYDTLRT